MSRSMKGKIKLIVAIALILCFVWFVIVSPQLTFHNNEKSLEQAAKRYYELYPGELPTGERIAIVGLNTLYHKALLEKDLYIPYTKKTCSISNSWVKVKRVNGEYKYYVYLECGVLSSNIDHQGPEIKLNGEDSVIVDRGEEYKELGVKSVIDNNDGQLKTSDVIIKGKVNTSKVGNYEITYIAFDNLKNKTEKKRTVKVVQRLNTTIKKDLDNLDHYVGSPTTNYVYFSNMLFRIIGLDSNKNVKIVAINDVANVNYDGIDKWLEYYESKLTDKAKKFIVGDKYCNMKLSDTSLDTTQCSSYTDKKKIGILTIDEINKATANENNFLIPETISWTGNPKDNKEAYAVRDVFIGQEGNYMSFEKKHNLGVRPVITIKGSILITGGNGTAENPYIMEEYYKPKTKVNVNQRYIGEYVKYNGMLWRIIGIEEDGTTKVACEESLYNPAGNLVTVGYDSSIKGDVIYNPKQKGNIGYKINNRTSEYIDVSYFVNHNFKVPVYNGEPQYGKEIKTKTFNAKIISLDMYEMFAAATLDANSSSYWFINSTKTAEESPGMSEIGAVLYGDASAYYEYGIRPVGFLNSSCVVTSGKGTKQNPFIIKK